MQTSRQDNSESYLPDIHRTLPHSIEAEQGVLGSMLISPREIIGECVEQITDAHFHVPAHATIYKILVEFWNDQKPLDFITLTQVLTDRKVIDQVGGAIFVTNLFTFVPTAANVGYYLEIVREKHALRTLITSFTESVSRAYEDQESVSELIDEAEQKIFALSESRQDTQDAPGIKDSVMEAIESIEALYSRRGSITGLATGFSEIDKMTDGLHPADMVVIAARPSMGKTAYAMQVAAQVALAGHPVAVFSLEMSRQQLVQRLLCSHARINLQRVRDGFLAERDFPMLTRAADVIGKAPLHIDDDTPGLTTLALRAKARRLKMRYGIELIVIDYLQLLRASGRRENRQVEISEISQTIKSLAKELDVPVLVCAQLNRNPENRTGTSRGRPRLSDLRESGSIEMDADVVGLLVREEYYAENDEDRQESEGKATLIIAKQRNGPTGDVPLTFLKEFTRFEDIGVKRDSR